MGLNISKLREKLNELTNKPRASDIVWKPTEGTHTIRIVPLATNPENPFIEVYFHYLGGKTQLSPLTFGEADPIAEFAESLRAGGHLPPEEWNETKKFIPVVRTYVPIIVRGQEDAGVKYWAFGKTIFKELLAIIDDEDYGDITHPKTGFDIKLTFTPKEKSPTNFPQTALRVARTATPISTDAAFVKRVLTEQPNLFDAYSRPTYEELKTFLERYLAPVVDNDDDEDWDTEDTDTSQSQSETVKKTKRSKKVEEEFDELFGSDEEDPFSED